MAIITLNEQNHIGRCIESVKDLADEIVVVDSFSTDKTKEICESYGVKFFENKFEGHIQQKNFAFDQCTGDYILSLDADEALSEQLRISIRDTLENFQSDGYFFNRLTNYNGYWVRHCGWYPDRKLRLVKNGKARWKGTNPHDILKLDNGTKGEALRGDLLHYSYDSISDHIQQTDRFTTIAARTLHANGKKSSRFKIAVRPVLKFLRDYLLKRGFLDGRYGLVICFVNAFYVFLKYSKLMELQDGKEVQ